MTMLSPICRVPLSAEGYELVHFRDYPGKDVLACGLYLRYFFLLDLPLLGVVVALRYLYALGDEPGKAFAVRAVHAVAHHEKLDLLALGKRRLAELDHGVGVLVLGA